MQTDPIADFLTRLRNAAAAKHQRVDVPVSKLKTEIARILKEEGYISTYKLVDENKSRKVLRVFLKDTPDLNAVPAETPASVRDLLRRCLEKDPRRRLRDILAGGGLLGGARA